MTTLGAVGHRVRERSILLVGVRILSRGIVRNLDLLRRLHIALGWQDLLSRCCMARGGIVGSGEGLSCGSHDEASLLRVLGDKWRLEQSCGWVSCFSRTLAVKAHLSKGVAEVICL